MVTRMASISSVGCGVAGGVRRIGAFLSRGVTVLGVAVVFLVWNGSCGGLASRYDDGDDADPDSGEEPADADAERERADGDPESRNVEDGWIALSDVIEMTASSNHTCALLASGAARCWGLNDNGQLGDGSSEGARTGVVVRCADSFVGLSASDRSTCGWTDDGVAWCWGRPLRSMEAEPLPVELHVEGTVRGVDAGGSTARGPAVWTTGGSMLIRERSSSFAEPLALVASLAEVAGSTIRGSQVGGWVPWGCAWHFDGSVSCVTSWPVGDVAETIAGLADVVGMTSSWGHRCAWTGSGGAFCWGENGDGQVGDGSHDERLEPVSVSGLERVAGMTAGQLHTCAWSRGEAFCWGANDHGQLGAGATREQPVPGRVEGLPGRVAGVAAGYFHTCAWLTDGTAWCWGENHDGQLGDGTNEPSLRPVRVLLE
jgi:hypothetical protein